MAPVNILYALSRFVPSLLRWAGHENGAEVAEKAVQVAKIITGKDTIEEQIESLKANPELAVQYQKTMNDMVIAQLDAETKQLAEINATMRAEYASNDNYTKRWRPTMGYALTFVWSVQMTALTWVIVMKTEQAAAVLTAMAGLTFMWGIALSVLGVAVAKRSEDKQLAAGFSPVGILGAVAKAFVRK
jgi:hypothetical protein